MDSENYVEDTHDSGNVMRDFMMKIITLSEISYGDETFDDDDDCEEWNFIENNLLYDDIHKHLPIPVFSYVKPTLGPRFILLSMGQFETEIDITLQTSLRDSLRYTKLIGPLDDENSLIQYSRKLLKRFIEEQLIYFPNSMNVMSQWILTASELFESVILRDEIPITDLPPAHQTALNTSKEEEVLKLWLDMKGSILCAAFQELESCIDLYSIPSKDEIMDSERVNSVVWNPVSNFQKHPDQSTASFEEQK